MALLQRILRVEGKAIGFVFTFEKEGDLFPIHTHTENDNHISILAFGKIRILGHSDYEGKEIEAVPGGLIINWQAGKPHGFVALSDGATLINILKRPT